MNYIIPLFFFILTIPQVTFPCSYQLTIQDKIMEHKEQTFIGTACAGLAFGAGYFVYNYYYKNQQPLNTPSPEPDLGQNTKNIFQLKEKETLTPKKQQFENVTNAQVYKNSNHISNPSQNPQETVVLKQNKAPLATTTNTPDDQQILWHAISNFPREMQQRITSDFLQQQGKYEKSSLGLIKITEKETNNVKIYKSRYFPQNLNDFQFYQNYENTNFNVNCDILNDSVQLSFGSFYNQFFYGVNCYQDAIFDGINYNKYCCIAHSKITFWQRNNISIFHLLPTKYEEPLITKYPGENHVIRAMGLSYFKNQIALCHTNIDNTTQYISILFFEKNEQKIMYSNLPFEGRKVSWLTDLTGIVLSKDGLLYTFALDRENDTISTHQQTIKDKNGKILRIRRIAADYINKHYIVFSDTENTGLFLIDLRSKQNTFIKLHYLSQEIANIKKIWMNNNTIGIMCKNETVTISNIDIIPEYALSNLVVDQKNKNS